MLDKITQFASCNIRFGSSHQKFSSSYLPTLKYIQKFKIYTVIKGVKCLVGSRCEHKKQMAIEFFNNESRIEKGLLIIKAAEFNC